MKKIKKYEGKTIEEIDNEDERIKIRFTDGTSWIIEIVSKFTHGIY